MNVIFDYDKPKDIWCLLNKGKASNNSQKPTKAYQQLINEFGDAPSEQDATTFIEKYITEQNIDVKKTIDRYKNEWLGVADKFQKRAEVIFNTTLPNDIAAYLTVNSRLPYDIEGNYFFVHMNSKTVRESVMHELWHFYTWYGLGLHQEKLLGKKKYNDLKEALTILIDIECKDLMPENAHDSGYPQHEELRNEIKKLWLENKNINFVWQQISR